MSAEAKKEVKKAKNERVSPKSFSAKQRADVMKRWYALREKGMNAQDAAKKVGVSYLSLHRWEGRFGNPTSTEEAPDEAPAPVASLQEHKEKKAKRDVKASKVEATTSGSIVVTAPNGYTVTVPDIETAKKLLS